MRTYWRQRNDLVRSAARHIQRIQKAMTQMNIQLANVLSDVSGMTGQAIIKAILAGERNPHEPAAFRDPRVKASEEHCAESGGPLARRSPICAEAGTRWLRDIQSCYENKILLRDPICGRRGDLHNPQLPALHLHCSSAREPYAGD